MQCLSVPKNTTQTWSNINVSFAEKKFTRKTSLDTHVKTANYCLELRGENTSSANCEYCKKEFSMLPNLKVHLKSCRVKMKFDEEKIIDENRNLKEEQKLWLQSEKKYKLHLARWRADGEKLEKLTQDQTLVIDKLQKEKIESLEKLQLEHSLIVEKLKQEMLAKEEKLQLEHSLIVEKLQQGIKSKDEKIIELEKNIEFGKGVLVGYEKVKPPNVTNNIVNQKLANLKIDKIRPATIRTITEDINFYNYDMYLKKEDGLVQFLTNMTQLKLDDGTIEQNYACTDKSRSTFHRLLDSREWKLDGGSKLINDVLDILLPTADEHWKTLKANSKMSRDIFDRDYYANKMMEMQKFHRSFERNTRERKDSVNKIKGNIRDILSI